MPTKLKRITFMVPMELEQSLKEFSEKHTDGNMSVAVRMLVDYGMVKWNAATKSSLTAATVKERH